MINDDSVLLKGPSKQWQSDGQREQYQDPVTEAIIDYQIVYPGA